MRVVSLAVALAVVVGGCRGKPVSAVPESLEVDWQPFRWADVRVGSTVVQRAAVLVETADPRLLVSRPGADSVPTVQLQLDFGFAGTGAFGIPLRTLRPLPVPPAAARSRFPALVTTLGIRDDSTGATAGYRLGTVGLLYYGVKGLIIDQVEMRVGSPRTGAALPAQVTSRMAWTEAREEAGRLAVPLVWRSDRLGALWFDPGSSLVPVLLDGSSWRLLTGRNGTEPDTRRLVFPVGRDSLVLAGAPTLDPFSLGGIRFGTVVVYRVLTGPPGPRPDRFPEGVVGVIGNQLFEDVRMLYVNVRARQLGVVR